MLFIAKDIRISRAKFHCNRLTTVQDIQDYARLIFGTHCILLLRLKTEVDLTPYDSSVDVE